MAEVCLENWVQHNLEEAVKHTFYLFKFIAVWILIFCKSRARLNVDEPYTIVLVYLPLKLQQLKAISPLARIHLFLGAKVAVKGNVLHSRQKVLLKLQLVLSFVKLCLKVFHCAIVT